ncbi:hypothetical protein [Streptomyces sp. NPDC091209]|uniref:hypothetical protein n=1 Tax=Streptomyces sp. NPDC091209 TaxID=3365974 RepID=UPI0037F30F26
MPRPEPRHPQPRVAGTPEVLKRSDVCALGRKYGGWNVDSPASVICGRTYGN